MCCNYVFINLICNHNVISIIKTALILGLHDFYITPYNYSD
jgi:hypothetical protein